MKKEATTPGVQAKSAIVPDSVTVRKRTKKEEKREQPSSIPPIKKRKSPRTSPSVPSHLSHNNPRSSSIIQATAANNSFTQIPDSEGEEDDEFLGGVSFDSDDFPIHAKNSPYAKPAEPFVPQDDNIVPESPVKGETTTARPRIASIPLTWQASRLTDSTISTTPSTLNRSLFNVSRTDSPFQPPTMVFSLNSRLICRLPMISIRKLSSSKRKEKS